MVFEGLPCSRSPSAPLVALRLLCPELFLRRKHVYIVAMKCTAVIYTVRNVHTRLARFCFFRSAMLNTTPVLAVGGWGLWCCCSVVLTKLASKYSASSPIVENVESNEGQALKHLAFVLSLTIPDTGRPFVHVRCCIDPHDVRSSCGESTQSVVR